MSSGRIDPKLHLAVLTVLVGVGSGVSGAVVAVLLRLVQHVAYGYDTGTFLDGVEQAPPWLRVTALVGAGLIGGIGWWALRRWGRPEVRVQDALDGRTMPTATTLATVGLQITVIALGASIGREVAPRLLGGLIADRLAADRVSPRARRILIACGAGAGLAAVYNVPLGGALFTLEVLLAELSPATVLAAGVTAAIATVVARVAVPDTSLYVMPAVHTTPSLLLCAALTGAALGVGGTAFLRLLAVARRHQPTGWRLAVVMPIVFAIVGAAAIVFPELLGNGRALGQVAFGLLAPAGALATLALLKAALTAGTIASGAEGGTLTPSVSIGAAAGAAAAGAWSLIQPDIPIAAGALVGAAAFLAVTLRAPITAAVLVLEFAGANAAMVLPVLIGVACAAAVHHGIRISRSRRCPDARTLR